MTTNTGVVEYEVYNMDDECIDIIKMPARFTEEEIIESLVRDSGYEDGIYLEKLI